MLPRRALMNDKMVLAQGENLSLANVKGSKLNALSVYGKSMQSGTPSPENPVPIVSAGSVMTTGAQLFNFNEVTYSNCNLQDAKTGTIKSNIINLYYCSIFIENLNEYLMENKGEQFCLRVNDNENKKISIVIYGTDESGYKTQESDVNGRFASIVINDDFTSIIRLELRVNRLPEAFTDTETIIGGIMFYKGDSDIAFEPYTSGQPAANPYEGEIDVTISDGGTQSQFLTVSAPGGLPGIPVDASKLPEGMTPTYVDESGQAWVCDEVDFKRGKYVQRVCKYTIDDSSNISSYIVTGHNRFNINDAPPATAKGVGYCDHFTVSVIPIINNDTDEQISCYERGGVYLRYDACASVEELKTWLTDNPVIYYYPLATPIETDLPAEEIAAYKALHTYSPATTVSNDAGAWMKVGYREYRR